MLVNRVVPIYTKDLQILFKVEVGKNNLVKNAVHKISKLYSLQKNGNKKAKEIIDNISDEISILSKATNTDLNKIKSKLSKQSINEKNISFNCLAKYDFKFGNELVFSLLRLIEICDLYFAYMMTSLSTQLSKNKSDVYSSIKLTRKKLFVLISKISSISLKKTGENNV